MINISYIGDKVNNVCIETIMSGYYYITNLDQTRSSASSDRTTANAILSHTKI